MPLNPRACVAAGRRPVSRAPPPARARVRGARDRRDHRGGARSGWTPVGAAARPLAYSLHNPDEINRLGKNRRILFLV